MTARGSASRYALYYAPHPESPLGRFGARWFGQQEYAPFTAAPRRYGFHATLKAPFHLADGARAESLLTELERFCATRAPIEIARLDARALDGFLALVPAEPDPRLDALAAACVMRFDGFRAAPGAAELERRRAAGLNGRQEAHLLRWGYPHVLDQFRFHLSLTGSVRDADPRTVRALAEAASAGLRALEGAPVLLDSVCVFEEPGPGADFQLLHRARLARSGRLIYVIGPSGAGKDSLLSWAAERLPQGTSVRFARRVITRAAGDSGESHEPASAAQFEALRAAGEFVLHWDANGARYGIRREILDWLARGDTVVVNGSRGYLVEALGRFPEIEIVHVNAPTEILRARIAARGRDGPRAAAARLARNTHVPELVGSASLHLVNDGPIEHAGARLAQFLAATGR